MRCRGAPDECATLFRAAYHNTPAVTVTHAISMRSELRYREMMSMFD